MRTDFENMLKGSQQISQKFFKYWTSSGRDLAIKQKLSWPSLGKEVVLTVVSLGGRVLLVEDVAELGRARPVVVAPVEHGRVATARVLH